jgi:putative oxidoreductase
MAHVDLALLIVRLALGITMALHGYNKVKGGIKNTAGWFGSIGMRPPLVQAWAAALTEIGGGLMFAAGLLMPLAAAAMIGLMLVAYVVAHRMNGFFIFRPNQGWEYVFMLAVFALGIGMIGAGKYSLDRAFGIQRNGWTGTWVTLVVGVVPAVAMLAACYRPPAPKS